MRQGPVLGLQRGQFFSRLLFQLGLAMRQAMPCKQYVNIQQVCKLLTNNILQLKDALGPKQLCLLFRGGSSSLFFGRHTAVIMPKGERKVKNSQE